MNTEKLGGCSLMLNRFAAILLKKSLWCRRAWIMCAVQVFLPILIFLMCWLINRATVTHERKVLPRFKMSLDVYDDPITAVGYDKPSNRSKHFLDFLAQSGKRVADWGRKSVPDKVMEETRRRKFYTRAHYIVGASFEKGTVTAWFNNDPLHSPPLSLQLAINAIVREQISTQHHIQFYNHPLPLDKEEDDISQALGDDTLQYFLLMLTIIFPLFILPYIKERVNKSKHLQFLSGISVITFWSASFLFDFLLYAVGCIVNIVVFTSVKLDHMSQSEELGSVFLLMLNFGLSALPLLYVLSLYMDSPGYAYIVAVAYFHAPGVIIGLLEFNKKVKNVVHNIAYVVPFYAFHIACDDVRQVSMINEDCSKMLKTCMEYGLPATRHLRLTQRQCDEEICKHSANCCGGGMYMFAWKQPGIGQAMCFLYVTSIIHFLLLLIHEYGFFNWLSRHARDPPYLPEQDDDVMEEKNKVESLSATDRRRYAIVMQDVSKSFRDFFAVISLNLTIKRRECFGLLGYNGAGKTTTFKMLTGEIMPSRGNIWVNTLDIKSKRNKINPQTGYCPQQHALFGELTCKETILVFALLRGLRKRDATVLAEDLARRMDFEEYLDTQAAFLSGGTKRKLNTAIALVGDPGILYLDEPTTGMDPASKRHIWDAFSSIRETGKCIVLTSHSMDECEALCTRLAIMVNGVFVCLGTLQHLKSKFSSGCTLIVRVKDGGDVQKAKTFIFRNFPNSSVSDSYQNTIYFSIIDSQFSWARAFNILETEKEAADIEDYSLSQSSLEQVFLSFTKRQRNVT